MTRVAFVVPSEVVQLVGYRQVHQVMVRRVELNRVNAHAVAVKSLQLRDKLIGLSGFFKGVIQTSDAPDFGHMVRVMFTPAKRKPFAQYAIISPEVLITHMGRHISDLMGRETGKRAVWLHGTFTSSQALSLPRLPSAAD